jgi:hypothetical protein
MAKLSIKMPQIAKIIALIKKRSISVEYKETSKEYNKIRRIILLNNIK